MSQPETAIDSWRQWDADLGSRPVIQDTLAGGRSNRSYLLDSDGFKMVLRLNGPDSVLPGGNRRHEFNIWRAASECGIAPPLLHVDEPNGWLVSTYIDNTLLPGTTLLGPFEDQALLLLQRCHQLEIETPAINYARHIDNYWAILETRSTLINPTLKDQRGPMQELLSNLLDSTPETGLCHHDPVVANFVGRPDDLYLIDWEYASKGLVIMDYAGLAVEWDLGDITILEQTGIKPESLSMAKTLYRYLGELWEEITVQTVDINVHPTPP